MKTKKFGSGFTALMKSVNPYSACQIGISDIIKSESSFGLEKSSVKILLNQTELPFPLSSCALYLNASTGFASCF